MNPSQLLWVTTRSAPSLSGAAQAMVLAHATRTGDDQVLVDLARRDDLVPEVEEALRSSTCRVFVAWLLRPGRTLAEKEAILASERRATVLAAVAADPEVPADLLCSLQGRLTSRVASALLRNPSAPDDLVLEAVLFFDTASVTDRVPGPVASAVESRPGLHDALALRASGALAGLVLASASVSPEARSRVVSSVLVPALDLLASEVRLDRANEESLPRNRRAPRRSARLEAALSGLLRSVEAAPELFAPDVLASLADRAFRCQAEYWSREWHRRLTARSFERGGAFLTDDEVALVDLAASSTSLDALVPALDHVEVLLRGSGSRARLALGALVSALVANPALSGIPLVELSCELPFDLRPLVWQRLSRALPQDREHLLAQVHRGGVPIGVVSAAVAADPSLGPLLVGDSRVSLQYQEAALASPAADPAWLLPFDARALASPALRSAAGERLLARTVSEGLGDDKKAWDVFSQLDGPGLTLGDRLLAARAV